MTVRTFKQNGQGYGSEPVGIIAKIDGVVVFEGTVSEIDADQLQNFRDYPGDTIFSWENTVDFSGTAQMEITVTGPGTLVVTDTKANYVPGPGGISSGPDGFAEYYNYVEEDLIISDPFVDPAVNETPVVRNRHLGTDAQLTGQWWYVVATGVTFTTTVNISPGSVTVS